MDSTVGFVNITFFNIDGKELASTKLEFLFFGDNREVINIPKGSRTVRVSFSIGFEGGDRNPSGFAKIDFLNNEGENLESKYLETIECSDEEEDFEVPKNTRIVEIYCTVY